MIQTPAGEAAFVESPSGQCTISSSQDGCIHMLDTVKGLLIGGELLGHTDVVTSIAFSTNSAQLVSSFKDSNIWLWDGVTEAPIAQFSLYHMSIITTLAFSPNGAVRINKGLEQWVLQQ
jgi:WD40 repeat protein